MTVGDIEKRISDRLGIDNLLPMQQEMLSVPLPGRVVLCAPTGSGKTLAFAIAMLRTARAPRHGVQCLVLAPARELVLQIGEMLRVLTAPDYKTVTVYGGHSYATEAASLAAGADIVVGTPGRVLDHIHRGRLDCSGVATLVIDEYDKALELGFHDEMSAITKAVGKVDTLVMTSATAGELPDFIAAVETVLDYSSADAQAPVPAIESYRVDSNSPDKLETLGRLLHDLADRRTIVFVNHRDAAERVADYLRREGFGVALYHGGMEQDKREQSLILFENGTAPVLVATDLAARGLDIEGVGAVVHYHLPSSEQAWTHRNGRTARMGASGSVYTILSEHDTVPEYIGSPAQAPKADTAATPLPAMATLYLNAGRKEKISRGDIAGFLIQKGGLAPDEVGRIDVRDHCAYVAVPAAKARATVTALAPYKIKNTRVRVTQLKTTL